MKCSFIHRRMILLKFVYLLYGALLGSHLPFLNIFFRSVGLSTFQAGTVTGVRLAAASLAGPLWNVVADYTGRRRLILIVLCIGSAFPMFMMPWIAKAIYDKSINGTCQPVNSHNATHILHDCGEDVHDAINHIYYILMSVTSFGSIFLVSLPSYIDGIALHVIQTDPDEPNYGTQRSFGSIGFAVGSFLSGITSDHFSEPNMSHYTPIFFIFLVCILLLIPAGNCLINQLDDNNSNTEHARINYVQVKCSRKGKRDSIHQKISCTLWRSHIIFFLITILISGFAHHIFMNFILLLLHDEKVVGTKTEMSLVIITAHISEIFIFPFTSRLTQILGGHCNVFILGVSSFFVRFMIISYDIPFYVIVLTQTLHTIGFGLFWSAAMEYMYLASPKEINLTMNGIMQTVYHGFSNLLANIVGAKLYEIYGGPLLFRGTAIVCAAWALLMCIYHVCKIIRKEDEGEEEGDGGVQGEINEEVVETTALLNNMETTPTKRGSVEETELMPLNKND